MTRAAAKTGAGPTSMVAVEQRFPADQRIIFDDLARAILPFGARTLVGLIRPAWIRDWLVRTTETAFPGVWGSLMCRKRCIDEKLTRSVHQIDAIVNLGAGFDTRLYRLTALAEIPAWEIDQPENINAKRRRLQKLFGAIPKHVTLVPIDLDRDELGTTLAAHGYSADQRTFFIWEAVTQYLTETAVRATFDFLATAAPGSRLAFTYICKDFLNGQNLYGQEGLYNRYIMKNRVWLFGIAPLEVDDFLKPYGWRVTEHLDYQELAERYVKPAGRRLASMPIERLVYAEKF